MHFPKFILGALLPALFFSLTVSAFTPKKARFGTIKNLEFKSEADLEWNEVDFGPRPTLDEDEKFAIVTVELDQGKTIGKFDYKLSDTKCLGMRVGNKPFSPLKWKEEYSTTLPPIDLLYKVEAEDEKEPFLFSMSYTVPSITADEQNIILSLVDPDAAPADAADPATPADGAPADPAPVEDNTIPAEPVEDKVADTVAEEKPDVKEPKAVTTPKPKTPDEPKKDEPDLIEDW